MKTSSNGIKFIEKEEGCILQAYDDYNDHVVQPNQAVRGTLTIGTGHTSSAGSPRVYVGQKITQSQADQILANDLGKVEAQVNTLVKVPLTQNQFDALVSFQFNTGGLGKSTALVALNNKDYQKAADLLLNWSKGNGNPTLLLGRRKRERNLFLGEYKPAAGTLTAATAVIVGAGSGAVAQPTLWPWFVATAAILLVGFVAYEIYQHYKRNQIVV